MSKKLAAARQAFYGLPSLPLHRYLGLVFERGPAGEARISLPSESEALEPDGRHSLSALFTLGEVACGVEACDAIWPYATERGLIPVGLTTTAHFEPGSPASGPIAAKTRIVNDIEELFGGEKPRRKGTVELVTELEAEDGTGAGRYRGSLYARFMDLERARALADAVPGLAEGAADLMQP